MWECDCEVCNNDDLPEYEELEHELCRCENCHMDGQHALAWEWEHECIMCAVKARQEALDEKQRLDLQTGGHL